MRSLVEGRRHKARSFAFWGLDTAFGGGPPPLAGKEFGAPVPSRHGLCQSRSFTNFNNLAANPPIALALVHSTGGTE